MKRLFFISGCYIILNAFSGCGDSSPYIDDSGQVSPNARYLYLETSSLSFEAVPKSAQTLNVKAKSTPWQFSGMESWLSATPSSGTENTDVSVSATENKSGDTSRSCIITLASTVSDYAYNHTVSVTQAYSSPYLNVEAASIAFSGASSSQSVAVSSNINWTAACDASWISLDKASDLSKLTITVQENTTGASREAVITLSGNATSTITVVQATATISPSSVATKNFDNTGGSVTQEFFAEAAWTATSTVSWIQVSPSNGNAGNSSITISVDATNSSESRTGQVNVSIGSNIMLPIPISQGGNYITPAEATLSFAGGADTKTVAIASNVSWTPSCSATWISYSKQGDNLQVSVSENTTNVSRSAKIELKGSSVSSSITVLQSAAGITTDQTSTIVFENTAGSYIINITSESAWTAETSQSWIMVSPESGTAGTSQLTVSTTPNESTNERNGFVYLKISGNILVQIPVTQKGIFLTVDPTTLNYESTSSQKIVSVRSNVSWSVLSAPSWLNFSATKGNGSADITITAQENALTTGRDGDIIIGKEGASWNATVKVNQAGKTFSDLIGSLSFSDKAGEQQVDIKTDGQWTASTDYSWISLNPVSGNGNGKLTVAVTENTSDEKRDGVVAVTVGATTKNISVTQSGKYFTVNSGGQATIPSTGGSHTVTFSTNESWTATSSSSWITLSPTSGNGDATLKITAGDNASINTRTDTTYITPAHIQGIKVITKQAARYLTVNTSQLSFFAKGGTSDVVTISTDASFKITSNVSWLTINQNGKTFTVTAAENTTLDTRYGKVTIAMTGLVNNESYSIDIDVVQKAPGGTFTINWFGEDQNWNF